MEQDPRICIVGLGYVGLPLAAAFGKSGWQTTGFDINPERIEALKQHIDWTHELTMQQLEETTVTFSADPAVLADANTIIIAVPTPIDDTNNPDLSPVMKASETVSAHLRPGMIVVYESTVYPGVTEDLCVPILEKGSGLTCGKDFWVGYSPERINPGDKEHTIDKITKVVAGQTPEVTDRLAMIYGKIITAGVYKAANIKAAELAKALENTQRDINIALMNEIAQFCDRLGIRTKDVLDAAATKWNFLRFTPGLVGGHCIGVDPYYLVHKANELNMQTEVISAGRKINDAMPQVIAKQILTALAKSPTPVPSPRVHVLGLTFKENIPDTRNAKVHNLIRALEKAGCTVTVEDPYVPADAIAKLGFTKGSKLEEHDVLIIAVSHAEFAALTPGDLVASLSKNGIVYDLKSIWNPISIESLGYRYLCL